MAVHRSILWLAAAATLTACRAQRPAPVAPHATWQTLDRVLRETIATVPEGQVAVAIHDLGTGQQLAISGDTVMHAASTMKVPVLIEYMQRRDRGELADSGTVRLSNRFRSVVDGSAYTLDAGDDSDSTVYAAIGQQVTWGWLATRMITHSSNLATNVLIERLGAAQVTSTMRQLGARATAVRRGVEDNVAFRAGIVNETTASDLATVMAAIATDRAGSPDGSRAMREILLAQAYNDGIPAGLPRDVRVAHKTGEITATHHDAAIVYPARGAPYVLVVLTRRIPDRARAIDVTVRIAREVHRALRPQ